MLTAVSLSIRRKRQTILWVSTGLPADAFALVAVPDKAAALLLCPNYLLYCQQVRSSPLWEVSCARVGEGGGGVGVDGGVGMGVYSRA